MNRVYHLATWHKRCFKWHGEQREQEAGKAPHPARKAGLIAAIQRNRLLSAHPEMANLPDIGVARKI
jgi:hypothetical protein